MKIKTNSKGETTMSVENAKKFIEILDADKELKERFIKDKEAVLKESGLDCTLEEVRNAAIDCCELDENELDTVSGGIAILGCPHMGNCRGFFWKEPCHCTVEKGSYCASNDYCINWSNEYLDVTYVVNTGDCSHEW